MPDTSPEHPVAAAIAAAPQPAREVRAGWHARALELEPRSTEGVSYGMPALRYRGRPLIAVAATSAGYSVHPFSPAVIEAGAHLLGDLKRSKGAIAFTDACPLPREASDAMLIARRAEIDAALDR
ncbi:hypothetical protein GCM10009792_02870 [Microcella alkalica]|uniref:Uncharacterized protein YdhG (YjbR/CyaY superfamily) n=1 Tax=Microcella alkalica TaxID=355930 RepID=A0A839EEH5_9MICO|nr:DUF1801 domain-containing protein [Microcella alkalica]MBA8848028.1 uncharacterized protein YdhG (YjbR/CyaY superfamily) [Microcella alkalica]